MSIEGGAVKNVRVILPPPRCITVSSAGSIVPEVWSAYNRLQPSQLKSRVVLRFAVGSRRAARAVSGGSPTGCAVGEDSPKMWGTGWGRAVGAESTIRVAGHGKLAGFAKSIFGRQRHLLRASSASYVGTRKKRAIPRLAARDALRKEGN